MFLVRIGEGRGFTAPRSRHNAWCIDACGNVTYVPSSFNANRRVKTCTYRYIYITPSRHLLKLERKARDKFTLHTKKKKLSALLLYSPPIKSPQRAVKYVYIYLHQDM